jgi:long-chain acyl-CoA synthetase
MNPEAESRYPGVTLHEVLRAAASQNPDRTAIIFDEQSLTLADLETASNRFAYGLMTIGVEPGDRVGLFTPNCPEFEIAFYAISKVGGIVCPLNSSYREREISYQLTDAGVKVLLAHARLWPIVDGALSQLPSLRQVVLIESQGSPVPRGVLRYEDLVVGKPTDAPPERANRKSLVALPYSSGTTGLPKGVMLTHGNLVCNHTQYVDAMRLGPDDCYIVYLPLSHIYGIALMGAAIMSGAKQIILERFDLENVVRLIETHRVTWLFTVPPVLLTLANAPGLSPTQFRSVKFAFSAAAPLAPEVARRVEARLGLRVIQGYGLTEASPATHNSPLDADCIKLESGGVPLAATEHRIVDLETGTRDLPPGSIGEIVVRGPQVMQGYWNAQEETAQALRDGWLYTGDVGWLDAEGYVYICDRKKEMIKYKSFSIAPAELESVLLEHADVEDCGVTGVEDSEAGELPKAFIVPRAGREIDFDALARFVAQRVAGYKQIRQFEVVDAIPRTPSGKILRRLLKA